MRDSGLGKHVTLEATDTVGTDSVVHESVAGDRGIQRRPIWRTAGRATRFLARWSGHRLFASGVDRTPSVTESPNAATTPTCLGASTSTAASQNHACVIAFTGMSSAAEKSPGGERYDVCTRDEMPGRRSRRLGNVNAYRQVRERRHVQVDRVAEDDGARRNRDSRLTSEGQLSIRARHSDGIGVAKGDTSRANRDGAGAERRQSHPNPSTADARMDNLAQGLIGEPGVGEAGRPRRRSVHGSAPCGDPVGVGVGE